MAGFETACAFRGNALKAAAAKEGKVLTGWSAIRRSDGLWQAEGFCHAKFGLAQEGIYVVADEGGLTT